MYTRLRKASTIFFARRDVAVPYIACARRMTVVANRFACALFCLSPRFLFILFYFSFLLRFTPMADKSDRARWQTLRKSWYRKFTRLGGTYDTTGFKQEAARINVNVSYTLLW